MAYHLTLKDNPLIANMPNKPFVENLVLLENVEAYMYTVSVHFN